MAKGGGINVLTVHKAILSWNDYQVHPIPIGAKFLHVADQNGSLCVWYLCNPSNVPNSRTFRVIGTGQSLNVVDNSMNNLQHVGTALMAGGQFVLHVFVEKE